MRSPPLVSKARIIYAICMKKILICLLVFVISASILYAQDKQYCIAALPAPVLNTPDFSSVFGGIDGKSVKVDKTGLIRKMEFVAFPGTVFEIDAARDHGKYKILQVRTNDYPYDKTKLYIDSRFVRFVDKRPLDRTDPPQPGEDRYRSPL